MGGTLNCNVHKYKSKPMENIRYRYCYTHDRTKTHDRYTVGHHQSDFHSHDRNIENSFMEKREFSTNPASKLYQIYKDKFNIVNQTSLTRQMTRVGNGPRASRQKMTHGDIKIHISLHKNVPTIPKRLKNAPGEEMPSLGQKRKKPWKWHAIGAIQKIDSQKKTSD